jgi:hypothetical protein
MRTARRVVVLLAIFVLALAPAAPAAIDYSMNAAGGDYAPAVPSQPDMAAASDAGFEWGDAAIGAGAALAVVLFVTGGRGAVGILRTTRMNEAP